MIEFYKAGYRKNLIDLFESAEAITQSETQEFDDKWRSVKLKLPLHLVDYEPLAEELETLYPKIAKTYLEPIQNGAELKDLIGDLAEPLVDFINMKRRTRLRQFLNVYVKMGYLEVGMSENAEIEYSISKDAEILPDIRTHILECVVSYGRFS